ncbi:hypothetical protein [Embleya sp. NPDC059259]
MLAALLLTAGTAALTAPVANAGTGQDIALNTSDRKAPAGQGSQTSDALGSTMNSLVSGLSH